MQLTSFIVIRKHVLKTVFAFLCLAIIGSSNFVIAESLTYSPDQWPRHWNVLMNKTHLQDRLNGYRANGKYTNQTPVRSPMWGVVPTAKQKSRRSLRPEYNSNSHVRNYIGHNIYQGNYYSGLAGYGLANPYNSSLLVPGLMPGLVAPGIPFGAYPYVGASPFMGGFPVLGGFPRTGYLW
ncbi:MAG: hypothetical protein KAJ39_06615 [Gammaproteobacteria bacterium]|nr:hypothetical protein [Gammaproteobacteria bacterium]